MCYLLNAVNFRVQHLFFLRYQACAADLWNVFMKDFWPLGLFYPHSIQRVEKIHEFSYAIPDWTAEIREPK